MPHNSDLLERIRRAYRAGASAARAGKMLKDAPHLRGADENEAWRNGWTDAAVHVGMVGTDWRPEDAQAAE
jgi:hypothetical protein